MEQGLSGARAGGPTWGHSSSQGRQGPPSTGLDLTGRQASFLLPGTITRQDSCHCSGSWLPRKGSQFHGPEHPVCCYMFYLCDLNSLRQNTLGYMLGRINRSGLRSLEVTQSRDKRPHHLLGGPGTTPGRELFVSSSASPIFLHVSCVLLVPGGLLPLQHRITQSEGVGRRRAGSPEELHFAPRSLKVLCGSYHVGVMW